MRTTLLAPLMLLGVLAFGLSGCGGSDGRITISPTRHDFGRVQQGDTPTKVFTVTNGSKRVVSLMPQANCSCFAVERGKSLQALDPGASMDVRIIFDSTAKPPGPVQGKWITFNTDHPKQRAMVVPLEGEIYKSFDVRPALINLGRIDGRPRNYETRTVRVEARDGYELRLERMVVSPDIFDLTSTRTDKGILEIAVALREGGRARPLGGFRADLRLELELSGPNKRRFQQRPVVKITGFWALKP